MAFKAMPPYRPRKDAPPHEFDKYNGVAELAESRGPTPIEEVYYSGSMFAKFEEGVKAMKRVVATDGEDEDDFDNFDTQFSRFLNFKWCSTWDGNKYDIVFYGVSGYTGYLLMQYMKRTALKRTPEKFTFAFAGRTALKVAEMRDREFIGTEWEDTPIIQASFDDPVSTMDLARSAYVIVNVAGPYMLAQGELLIDACCRTGTHYCDVSGEIPWTMRTLDLHEHAKKGKALICPSAAVAGGYPDILTYLCAKKIREEHGEELRRAICYARGGGSGGGTSGGTLATRAAMGSASDEIRKAMADPFALGGFIPEIDRNGVKEVNIKTGTGEVTIKTRKEDNDSVLSKVQQCPYTGVWRAPHVYAYFDTRIMRRSNALFADLENQPYGKNFSFQEFAMVPPAAVAAASLNNAAGPAPAGAGRNFAPSVESEKEALKQAGRYFKQGDGPPLEELHDAWLSFSVYAESTSGHKTYCAIVGRDGYFETARCAVEFALTCRFDYDKLPHKGGVLNATVAGQSWYAQRLINSGVKFKMGSWFTEDEYFPPDF